MSPETNPKQALLEKLRQEEYDLRMEVLRLRRELYEQPSAGLAQGLLADLLRAEGALAAKEAERAAVQSAVPKDSGLVVDTRTATSLLGRETTGLEAEVYLRMAQVPTAICHLLGAEEHPLLSFTVKNFSDKTRRVRMKALVEGYSAPAITTFEIPAHTNKPAERRLLPTFFPEKLQGVTELTRATLDVMLEDLDGKVELHQTYPVWLLARTAAPLAVQDPKTGLWQDMSRYYGAFVTPNAPAVLRFLRKVVGYHPARRLAGYQRDVEPQVEAVFEALKAEEISYVSSPIAFSPEEGFKAQRVRLPRESLEERQANCIDGAVLFASCLEAIALNAAIVIVPQHAFVAWETARGSDSWKYLETTSIGNSSFAEACAVAQAIVDGYEVRTKEPQKRSDVHFWPLRVLRGVYKITPLE